MIGSAIIVVGLYSVLWGKYKEDQEQKNTLIIQEIPEIVKDNNYNNRIVGEEKAAVAIDLPIFTSPVKPTQQVWNGHQITPLSSITFWGVFSTFWFTLFDLLEFYTYRFWLWINDLCKVLLLIYYATFRVGSSFSYFNFNLDGVTHNHEKIINNINVLFDFLDKIISRYNLTLSCEII